jgi:hypothetical protein
MAQVKSYQYQAVIIADPAHLNDPDFLLALNVAGRAEGGLAECPLCGKSGCAFANGYKRSEEQAKGARQQVILLEREVISNCG